MHGAGNPGLRARISCQTDSYGHSQALATLQRVEVISGRPIEQSGWLELGTLGFAFVADRDDRPLQPGDARQ
jgi:hypothetical protein